MVLVGSNLVYTFQMAGCFDIYIAPGLQQKIALFCWIWSLAYFSKMSAIFFFETVGKLWPKRSIVI